MPPAVRTDPSRREFLRKGLVISAGLAGTPMIARPDHVRAAAESPTRRRVLRLAHLTDIHLMPERGAAQGMIACLRHGQALGDPPTMILNGGDSVMGMLSASAERGRVQANLWRKVLRDECALPMHSCIGNHDIWGWDKQRSGTTGNEPMWGKAWALDLLGLEQRYYSFDRAGWHFIVLDSIQPAAPGRYPYLGKLDEQQADWLAADLNTTPRSTPVLVLSHIPILSITGLVFDDQRAQDKHLIVPGSCVHLDSHRIKQRFAEHGNVRLALAGHMHLLDRVDYEGVTYICGGAVCGNWWKGDHQHCDEGYGIVDLYDDGTFDYQYVAYGWTPRPR